MSQQDHILKPELLKPVDTRTIIISLLDEEHGCFVSMQRLQKLMDYLYAELKEMDMLKHYHISFNINSGSVEKTVLLNRNIFGLDADGENLYLRRGYPARELAEHYPADRVIHAAVRNFVHKTKEDMDGKSLQG